MKKFKVGIDANSLKPLGLDPFELLDWALIHEAGRGLIDLRTIFEDLSALPRELTLSIEDHGGDFLIPVFDPDFLAKFPDLTVQEFGRLLKTAADTQDLLLRNEIAVLDRARWPEACEARIERDLKAVQLIIEEG